MRLAVITTEFLEEYARYALGQLNPRCDVEFFVYRDFRHVGELYLELENRFDGFLVSGPVPKEAILRRAGTPAKPVESFGSDAQCYYEAFFRVQYEQQDFYLEHGYFDLTEWMDNPQPIASYLAAGTFGKLLDQVYEQTMLRSLEEITELEQRVLEKHLTLWREGKIRYSVTRFSNMVPQLQAAGVKVYFVYPHLNIIRAALEALLKDIDLGQMYGNQLAIIRLSPREKGLSPQEDGTRLDRLEAALSAFNQEEFCGFVIQRDQHGLNVFTQIREARRLTEQFQSCALRPALELRCGFPVSVGYGLGRDASHAMFHAVSAERASTSDPNGYSYFRDEREEDLPLSKKERPATVYRPETATLRTDAQRLGVSSMTLQRLLDAVEHLGTDQVTSQSLAAALGVTARSANRILGILARQGGAQLLFQHQSCAKGRPERVYRLTLDAPAK